MYRRVRMMWLAMLVGCADTATPATPAEPCNGIDDNGNGLVDEGCPCQAYSTELPFAIDPTLVSLGVGWAAVARDASSASYVHIDDAGHVATMAPIGDLALTDGRRALAWDGVRLAYLGGTGDTHLALLTPDGNSAGDGPSLGLGDSSTRMIAVTANGYDAVAQPPGLPGNPTFFTLDHIGAPTTMLTASLAVPIGTFNLVEREDGPVLQWTRHASLLGDDYDIGAPWQGLRYASATASYGDAASDGTTVLATGNRAVFAYDGAAVTPVPGISGEAIAVAWTGRSWRVVTKSGDDVQVVTLDGSRSVTGSVQIFTVPPSSGSPSFVSSVAIAGDARRTLVALQIAAAPSDPVRQQLIQLCP